MFFFLFWEATSRFSICSFAIPLMGSMNGHRRFVINATCAKKLPRKNWFCQTVYVWMTFNWCILTRISCSPDYVIVNTADKTHHSVKAITFTYNIHLFLFDYAWKSHPQWLIRSGTSICYPQPICFFLYTT